MLGGGVHARDAALRVGGHDGVADRMQCYRQALLVAAQIHPAHPAFPQELGRLGRAGRMAGNFHYLHQVSIDSNGNIYTAEVDSGKRLQKFLRYGALGCSGTGFDVVGGEAPENR